MFISALIIILHVNMCVCNVESDKLTHILQLFFVGHFAEGSYVIHCTGDKDRLIHMRNGTERVLYRSLCRLKHVVDERRGCVLVVEIDVQATPKDVVREMRLQLLPIDPSFKARKLIDTMMRVRC